ncbi:hypothetical protein PIB30_005375 [Stylosanthes scabra]|uniref:Uncharacterized protein n=1 Tax=Stylosanthes scabra TaxID=79078 RepID=A0ABU6W222_9FABA|nr:hypothetical protein [Stylosanthes scabra]
MMVRRPIRKKSNKSDVSFKSTTRSNEGIQNRKEDSEGDHGSRFNVLSDSEENITKSANEQNQHEVSNKAQKDPNKGKQILSKVLKSGAESTDDDRKAMEELVFANMQKMKDAEREAFETSKIAKSVIANHIVTNSFFTQSPLSFDARKTMESHVERHGPPIQVDKPPDLKMEESGDANSGSRKTDSGLEVGWNCRGVGNKTFPTLIKDIQREYDANFFILIETHVSGDRGKKIHDRIGFDRSFIEEAHGHSGEFGVSGTPQSGLDMPRILLKERGAFGNTDAGGAWLSSARAVRCWVKSRNERNPRA